MLLRVISVYAEALYYGTVDSPEIWQICLIVACLLVIVPLTIPMTSNRTTQCKRWSAFFVSIGCVMTAVITFCYPISQWPQGLFFGIVGVLGLLWIAIGFQMISRYTFLIQRGWTEKEKVARKRARRRRYQSPEDIDEEDESKKKLSCRERCANLRKFFFLRRPKSIFAPS